MNVAYSNIYGFMAIVSQMIHYCEYRRGIEPIYLKPLMLMSGMYSIDCISEKMETKFAKMVKLSKFLFKLSEFGSWMCFSIAFLYSLIPIFSKFSSLDFLLYGLPWSVLFGFSSQFAGSFLIWQTTYFYIICYYFKLQLNHIYEQMNKLEICAHKSLPKQLKIILQKHIIDIIHSLYSIFNDIISYNNYWSKYIFCNVILNGTSFNTFFICNLTVTVFEIEIYHNISDVFIFNDHL